PAPTRKRDSKPSAKTFRLRQSPVHGRGLFAVSTIARGERLIEYVGERISHAEADRRHANKPLGDNHTFLFTVDSRTVIDGGTGGNVARFINPSCDPNCGILLEEGRLYVEAEREIRRGEELTYDYWLNRAPDDPPNVDEIYACRCGAAKCRGTMLA